MNGVADAIERATAAPSRAVHKRPTASAADFFSFVRVNIGTDKGAFAFDGYKPLRQIGEAVCRNEYRNVSVVKPTQCGFTTLLGFGFPLWQAHRNGRNVGYFVPTNEMATAMLKTRLRAALQDTDIDVKPTPSDGLVIVGGRRLLWLGLEAVTNAISWPLDVNVYDEVDDLNQENLSLAHDRLDNSDYKHEVAFARGRYPGEGIHRMYLDGDRRRWIVTCQACRHEHIPEDVFPNNMRFRDEHWRTICPSCGVDVDCERQGTFVATKPENEPVSYQVSALAFGKTDLDWIMDEWRKAQNDRRKLALFRQAKLGIVDAGDRQALTAEDLARAGLPGSSAVAPRWVGVDVGDRCHIAAGGMHAERFVLSQFDVCRAEDVIERLRGLDSELRQSGTAGIGAILIDQKPDGSLGRAVCREFPGRAWLQEFRRVDAKEDEKELDGETFDRLVFEREESIGHFCDRIKARDVLVPTAWDGVPFAASDPGRHILTGSQREEKRDSLGITVLKFRSGSVENHWLMASTFAYTVYRHAGGSEQPFREIRASQRKRVTGALSSGRRKSAEAREFAR